MQLRHRDITGQRNIFTLTRKTDPDTCRLAESKVKESLNSHCNIVYAALRKNNGSTARELALKIWPVLKAEQVWKRLSTLKSRGKIRRGQARICKVTESRCNTWWII